MANIISKIRTNYFGVTDVDKFIAILNCCDSEDGELHYVTEDDSITTADNSERSDGRNTKYTLISEGDIAGIRIPTGQCDGECNKCFEYDECYEYETSFDAFLEALQSVLAPNDAIIMMGLSYEKMVHLNAWSIVITPDAISDFDLEDISLAEARRLLNNRHWNTKTTC